VNTPANSPLARPTLVKIESSNSADALERTMLDVLGIEILVVTRGEPGRTALPCNRLVRPRP